MSRTGYKKRFHFKNIRTTDPAVRRFGDWLPENRGFYASFRKWLQDTGYGSVAVKLYTVFARQAIGFIDKPYWTIDPEVDLQRFWQHLHTRPLSANTLADYHKGMRKFAEYMRLRNHCPPRPMVINWDFFTGSLPAWLQEDVRQFLHHCQRKWKPDRLAEMSNSMLSHLTVSLRWIVTHFPLAEIGDLTPQVWYAYLDQRLASGILPRTTNANLSSLKHLLHFLQERERPICERFLFIDYLDNSNKLPRDVPIHQLRRLLHEIQTVAAALHAYSRRLGRMDLAWFLLMLHSGLRTSEVRFLRLQDIDWQGRKVRIEQSKGLKDRLVCLSQPTIDALQGYLEVRGLKEALPEHVFVFRHQPLSLSYCSERLRTYGTRCGVHVTPHQLRHSCATLLLNSGAPVLTVQAILGHKWVDTTLGYARLYDGTVAADYYAAMALIERRLVLPEDRIAAPPQIGQLIALLDSLRSGTLNASQSAALRQLRAGILAFAKHEDQVIKVLPPGD
jgi:site-specific recombinase XerD